MAQNTYPPYSLFACFLVSMGMTLISLLYSPGSWIAQTIQEVEQSVLDDDEEVRVHKAKVTDVENKVTVTFDGQSPRDARIADTLEPYDTIASGRNAFAKLLFDDRFLAWLGSQSEFRFRPITRIYRLCENGTGCKIIQDESFQLNNGTTLVIVPPNTVGPQFQTVDSLIEPNFSFSESLLIEDDVPSDRATEPDFSVENETSEDIPISEDRPIEPDFSVENETSEDIPISEDRPIEPDFSGPISTILILLQISKLERTFLEIFRMKLVFRLIAALILSRLQRMV